MYIYRQIRDQEADKGSGVVVWDRGDYIAEAESQLNDIDVYEEVNGDTNELITTIKEALYKLKNRGDITVEVLDFFLVENPKLARFYLLPKIHKRLHNVPGRPVISNCNYFTENISAFLDFHIQPLAKDVKSYIKDTNDFLLKLEGLPNLSENAILCCIDVVGLYPNIPHDDGLLCLRKRLDSRTEKNVSTDSLVELAEVVLRNNVFQFNSKTYKQKRGTAIGTKCAHTYAIIFMAELEEKILNTCTLKPLIWWRYIDDIFFIWEHGEESLSNFMKALNEFHSTIKFTSQCSNKKINFLDVNIELSNGRLSTDLFIKSTDTHQYLESSSCHPYHCKKGIPYSQALRVNRICSNVENFDKRCNDLEFWLKKRGYNEKMVRGEVLRARALPRNELLNRPPRVVKDNLLTFNISYYPQFRKLKEILKETHILLTPNEEHKRVFTDVPIVGFKNNKSLKGHLVNSSLKHISLNDGKSQKCNGNRCDVCSLIQETSVFSKYDDTENFDIRKGPLDCNSKYVVYQIECNVCSDSFPYIGSTITKFRTRINNYKSAHKKFRKAFFNGESVKGIQQHKFHKHYCQEDHSGINDWNITLIDQVKGDLIKLREKESFWQHRLDTLSNGLNDKEVPVL